MTFEKHNLNSHPNKNYGTYGCYDKFFFDTVGILIQRRFLKLFFFSFFGHIIFLFKINNFHRNTREGTMYLLDMRLAAIFWPFCSLLYWSVFKQKVLRMFTWWKLFLYLGTDILSVWYRLVFSFRLHLIILKWEIFREYIYTG